MAYEIHVGFHNGSDYDYYLIRKGLTNKFERQFECLGENREKYKNFSIPMKKEVTNIDKNGIKIVVTICLTNLFAVQDFWQVHYQILLIISQKEFTKLNVMIVTVILKMKVLRIF